MKIFIIWVVKLWQFWCCKILKYQEQWCCTGPGVCRRINRYVLTSTLKTSLKSVIWPGAKDWSSVQGLKRYHYLFFMGTNNAYEVKKLTHRLNGKAGVRKVNWGWQFWRDGLVKMLQKVFDDELLFWLPRGNKLFTWSRTCVPGMVDKLVMNFDEKHFKICKWKMWQPKQKET